MTEQLLAACFVRGLSQDLGSIRMGSPAFLATEVVVQQGVADAVLGKGGLHLVRDPEVARVLDSYTNAKVLSLLNGGPRSTSYLGRRTQLPSWRLLRTLEALERAHLAMRCSSQSNSFVLSDVLRVSGLELWAFEFKLALTERALFQALQYRTFAHRVAIVVPTHPRSLIQTRMARLKALGVGLLAVDPENCALTRVLDARRVGPFSRFHHIYALGRVLRTATFIQ